VHVLLGHLGRLLLLPLSWAYGIAIRLRNAAYDVGLFPTVRISIPVISVGNISTGGTGKTPMAELLIRELIARGRKPGYLSRGYGRNTRGYLRVDPIEHTSDQTGDEAMQVALKFSQVQVPVAVCEDRVRGAKQLIAETGIDVLVLDDAFQHRRIARQLDWVMVDGQRPPWQDQLLPAGNLREPRASLDRADLVVVNKLTSRKHIPRFKHRLAQSRVFAELVPTALVSLAHGERLPIDEFHEANVWVFAALGNNQHFFDTFSLIGMRVVETRGFADHHHFSAEQIKSIVKRFRRLERQDVFRGPLLLVTSEKDAARLRNQPWFQLQMGQLPLYYLEVELNLYEGKDIFTEQLDSLLGTHAGSRSAAVR